MSLVALPATRDGQRADSSRDSAEAFDDLFRTYAPRVKALAERRLPGRHVADDVVQETFLRAYRSFGGIDPDRPVWPWLRTVATNVCVDIVRQRRHTDRDSALGDASENFELIDAKSEPSELHLAGQRRHSIAAALAAVNPRQRRVVVLKDIEGWETEEVAQLEGITVDAVKSTLKRGRHAFRTSYLALANRNGLLGGFGLLGFVARVRRTALRWRATTKAGSAALPAMPLLPLAVMVTLAAGGVAGLSHVPTESDERGTGPFSGLVAVTTAGPTNAAVDHAQRIAGGQAGGSDAAAAGSRSIAALGNGDVALATRLHRNANRVLLETTVNVEPRVAGKGLDRPWVMTITVSCGEAVHDTACDASEAAWSNAPSDGTPQPPTP